MQEVKKYFPVGTKCMCATIALIESFGIKRMQGLTALEL